MAYNNYFSEIADGKSPATYNYFDGEKWTVSLSGKTIDVVSPIDGKVMGKIQEVSHSEIDQAIDRAKEAQLSWKSIPMIKRAKILHLAADWIRQHEHYLTTTLIREIGKPFSEAKDEILRSADMIDYFANEGLHVTGEELSGEVFPGYDQTKMAIVERVPLGTVLAIAPFNYPVNLAVSKIAPALIMGNAVVFKPPSQGGISGLHLAQIFYQAGLPKGLIVIVTGRGEDTGNYLCVHQGIDMVTFTGSSQVGKSIAEEIGMIPILFECGGNNPAIVLPDADLQFTATEIVKGAFSFAGQRCTAIKYVLGMSSTIDELLPLVVVKTKEIMKMGDPREEKFNMGPVISDSSAQTIEKRILKAKADGAKVVVGGKRDGRYIEPTILDMVKSSMEIIQTETFGPVVSFIRINSVDEAVKIIRESNYGLQASVFTSDEGAGIKLAQIVDVGTVQINSKPQRGPDHFPFLGIKGSGSGVQGIRYTLEAMSRLKPIVLNKPQ
ncbi:aldehyde dehydrogenase family protein [Patescibacteria group bacterium]|nr:aldehyde dehydrogenase family protein [Patescibacteria group bacterium]MCL5798075.1 aldehyde dehydrogenase family protein [Patescibacteria group bacterium]